MKKFLKQIGLLSLALVSMSALAQAQVTTTPQLLIYEGELLDDTGTPAVGSFTFRFSFWDNSDYEATDVVGGNINVGAIDYRGWTEVQTTSTIADGSFSLQMSDVTPFTAGLFDQDNLFLQVEVKNGGDPDTAYEFVDINLTDPLEDRKIITSVPFAFNANKLDYKELGFGAGNIPYLDIAGLLPSTVIPDLDLTADDLDLADITLSDFTNDLTLNDGQVFIGDATNIANAVNISGDGTLDNTGLFTLALNSIGEDELDFGNVTLADFTNDVGFVTTDTLGDLACAANEIAKWDGLAWICSPDAGGAAFTASGGVTLTGSDFTADLGTDIETAEIQDDAVTIAKIGGAGIDQVLTSDGAGNAQWEDRSNFAISALTTNNIFVGDGAGVAADTAVTGDITMIGGNFQLVTNAVESAEIADDAVSDAEIDFANVTLNDFTNDAGFLTTVDVSDNTNLAAGTGIDLTDDTLSTTLGTTIEVSEIVSAGLADANKILTTDGVGAPQWEDKLNFATSVQGALADTALQAGDNVSTLTNDAGFLTAVDVSDNTNLAAGTGATLTGDILSVDLGTSIDAAEIDTNAVADDEIDYASVTLSDFTNDAGFLTTDSDTTYLAGLGLNLVGTTFSTTLGTAIDSSEITDGSIAGIDLDFGDITLADFTNDAGFLTAVDVSDNTNLAAGTGATLTGDTISVDLGTSIDAAEIDTNAVNDDEINYANVTLADFTNDAGYLNTVDISADTNLAVGAGLMLVGDSIISDLGSDIISAEIVDGTITDSDLNLASITLNDFTNDSGFITAETQDISLVGSNLSITGGSTIDLSVIDTNTDTLSDLGCAPGEVAKWNGTAWVCAPDSGGTSYTASDGVTLVGSNFTNDFGSSIESNEITNGTIGDQDLNLTDITLADFTNDVGFITTDGDTLNDLACAANEIARFNGTIWVCAGGPVSITKVLSPRYAGSIFEADGTNNTGSMHEEEDTTLSGIRDTVLRWFSRQVVLNDYDIIVEWTIPDDFDSFEPTPLSLDYQTDGLVSDALIDMTVQHNGDADDEIIGTGIALNSNAWTTTNFVVDGTTTWNVGDTMKIRLTMKAKDSNSAQVGNIKINYVRK